MKTAYAYARFSSDNQREESIDAQVRAISEYCDTKDIKILQIFKDEAYSARTANRPAFQQMFSVLAEYPADYVIVHKLDRFARNRYDAALYRKKLKDSGARLISVLEPMDDSPESIIVEGLLESMNEYYSANLSRETKKGQRENVLNGKRCGAHTPRGYDCVNQRLVPNADAPLVKKLFRLYADGASYTDMIKATGIKGPTICAMLKNENYIGVYKCGANRNEKAHEPIIDMETWNRCQKRLHDRAMNAANKAKHDYMLSGILYCAKCGRRMTSCSATKGDYHYYRCKNRCNTKTQEWVEGKVIDELAKYMAPTDAVKAKFRAFVESRVNSRANAEQAKKTNAMTQKRIDKIMNSIQYADEEQAAELLATARELKKKLVPIPKPVEVPKEVTDAFIERLADFKNLTPQEQKPFIRLLVSRVVVDGDKVKVYLPDTLGAVSIS